ncbi:unnamed protein product [Adineta ricciae]|uniref:B box-type domain-containing protein n=1 Tax=Adineta ricciae TaxID=249248 RepID=A0A814CVV8_ADIRI|nr:unnamed protein product [Adineta ricciae]CAF1439954.1 unnamed protein product [Adineta ricciae]
MSRLRNTSRLSTQTSTTINLTSHTLTNELHERKTKALEGGLNKLKVTVLCDQAKALSETSRTHFNKGSAQYSTDESHDKPSGRSVETKVFTIHTSSNCGQCEKEKASVKCLECGEHYCTPCFEQFHTRGALQRHHYVSLTEEPTSPRKTQSRHNDASPPLSSYRQENNDTERRYVITVNKNTPSSSRQAFTTSNNPNRARRTSSKQEVITSIHAPSVDQEKPSSRLPTIDMNTIKTTSNEKSFTKTFRLVDQNTQAVYVDRPKRSNVIQQQQQQQPVKIPTKSHSRTSIPGRSNSEHLNRHTTEVRTAQRTYGTMNGKPRNNSKSTQSQSSGINQRLTKSCSRSPSLLLKQDSTSSQLNLKHSLSPRKSDDKQQLPNNSPPLLRHQPMSTVSDSVRTPDIQSNVIDEYSIARFNSVLDDIVDKTKLELANRMNRLSESVLSVKSDKEHSFTRLIPMDPIVKPTKRDSPFSFSNSLKNTNRIHSASSRNAGDDAFFTDVLPQQVIPSPSHPPLILECSSSNKWHEEETRILSASSSNHSILLDETPQQSTSQLDNQGQQNSSALSTSLHIALASLETDLLNPNMEPLATSSRINSSVSHKSPPLAAPTRKSSISALRDPSPLPVARNSSSSKSTSKSSSPSPSTPKSNRSVSSKSLPSSEPVIERFPSSTTISANEQRTLSSNKIHENASKPTNSSNVPISSTVVRNEKHVVQNLPPKKTLPHPPRQITASDDSSKYRKLEFSLHTGVKWEEASIESMSSTRTVSSFQSSLIPIPHTQFAEDTSISENEEYSSPFPSNIKVNMQNSDRQTILNEKNTNVRGNTQLISNKNDLNAFQTQLPESENLDPVNGSDNESSIYE